MGIDDIIARIEQDAQDAATELKKEADTQRRLVIDEAKRDATARRTEIVAEAEAEAALEHERVQAAAELEARIERLRLHQRMVDSVLAEVRKRLDELTPEERGRFLAHAVLERAETGEERIAVGVRERDVCTEEWLQRLNEDAADRGLEGRFVLETTDDTVPDGFILQGPGYEVRAAIEDILSAARERFTSMIVEVLTG